MSAPETEWRKSGTAVPILCVLCLVILALVTVLGTLVGTGVVPFAA